MMTKAACKIPGCGKPRHARGLCPMHYQRERTGYEGKHEEIAAFVAKAVVYAGDECLLWPYAQSWGYGVWKANGFVRAHRHICRLAHGDPPTPQHHAAHACGNSLCVAPNHLRWATSKENQADKLSHGTVYNGERHHRAKLTEVDVRAIRSQPERSLPELSRQYGVAKQTICDIRKRKNWAWLEDE